MDSILKQTRRPDVTFYRNGRIDISSRVAKMLHLDDGDVVDVGVQDGEYYLYIRSKASEVIGRHEAQCYASKPKSKNFRAYSKRLCDAILRATASPLARIPAGEREEFPQLGVAVPLIIRLNMVG